MAALAALFFAAAARANAAPAPSPTATPAQPPAAAAAPALPANFDPCGGPLELLNKIGNGTACVFVRGEGAIDAQYGSANVPASTAIEVTTPFGSRSIGLSTAAHGFAYPAPSVYVGVLPRAQIVISAPSFAQINSSAAAALTGSNVLAAGTTNMKFEFKDLAYVNPTKFTMLAFAFDYEAPTGSPVFSGSGPSYSIDPIITQPLPHNFGATLAFPVTNAVTGTFANAQRGWNWSPQFVPYWESPGGTLIAVVVEHNFNPSVTPVVFSAAQLFGRHFMLSVAEGGFSYSTSGNGLFLGIVHATVTAYPSLFTIGASYLIGQSNLPAGL